MDSDHDIYSDKDLLNHILKKIAVLEARLNILERKQPADAISKNYVKSDIL